MRRGDAGWPSTLGLAGLDLCSSFDWGGSSFRSSLRRSRSSSSSSAGSGLLSLLSSPIRDWTGGSDWSEADEEEAEEEEEEYEEEEGLRDGEEMDGDEGCRSAGSDSSRRSRCSSSSSSRIKGSGRAKCSFYSGEADWLPWKEEAEMVQTSLGAVRVTVCGDRSRPALVTYHDVGLNHRTCFQGLLRCPDTAALLLNTFCVYHIDSPGHEVGFAGQQDPAATDEAGQQPQTMCLRVEQLAQQVGEVVHHYGFQKITCMGVAAGAYILLLVALAMPKLVSALILVSPVCGAATWSEWLRTAAVGHALKSYGVCRFVKDFLTRRFFAPSQDQPGFHNPGSDALLAFRKELEQQEPESVWRYMEAMQGRMDVTGMLALLQCSCLIVVGEMSPLFGEAEALRDELLSVLQQQQEERQQQEQLLHQLCHRQQLRKQQRRAWQKHKGLAAQQQQQQQQRHACQEGCTQLQEQCRLHTCSGCEDGASHAPPLSPLGYLGGGSSPSCTTHADAPTSCGEAPGRYPRLCADSDSEAAVCCSKECEHALAGAVCEDQVDDAHSPLVHGQHASWRRLQQCVEESDGEVGGEGEADEDEEDRASAVLLEQMRSGLGVVAFASVPACGTLVTEERPHTMLQPLERFLSAVGHKVSLVPLPRPLTLSQAHCFLGRSSSSSSLVSSLGGDVVRVPTRQSSARMSSGRDAAMVAPELLVPWKQEQQQHLLQQQQPGEHEHQQLELCHGKSLTAACVQHSVEEDPERLRRPLPAPDHPEGECQCGSDDDCAFEALAGADVDMWLDRDSSRLRPIRTRPLLRAPARQMPVHPGVAATSSSSSWLHGMVGVQCHTGPPTGGWTGGLW